MDATGEGKRGKKGGQRGEEPIGNRRQIKFVLIPFIYRLLE